MSGQGGNGSSVSTDVLQEIVVAAGDPSLTLDGLGQQCNLLYQLAEQKQDEESVALVTTVWDGVVKLSEQAGHAINIATAAREIAVTLQEQRDAALKAHEELQTAVESFDMDNPLVSDLVEQTEDCHLDMLSQSGVYISYCPACDITEIAMIPVSHPIAEAFHSILTGGYSDYGLSDEIMQEIAEFMAMIVRKADKEIGNE